MGRSSVQNVKSGNPFVSMLNGLIIEALFLSTVISHNVKNVNASVLKNDMKIQHTEKNVESMVENIIVQSVE